jgi:hypothetical protein
VHSHLHATYAFSAAEGLLDTCLFFAYAHVYSTVQLIKRGEMYPSHLPKSELKQCFLRRCSATTRISRGGEVVVRKGAAPVVSCSREKRQGHTITRILGVESYMVSAVCAIWCSWVARYLLYECLKYTLAVAGTSHQRYVNAHRCQPKRWPVDARSDLHRPAVSMSCQERIRGTKW